MKFWPAAQSICHMSESRNPSVPNSKSVICDLILFFFGSNQFKCVNFGTCDKWVKFYNRVNYQCVHYIIVTVVRVIALFSTDFSIKNTKKVNLQQDGNTLYPSSLPMQKQEKKKCRRTSLQTSLIKSYMLFFLSTKFRKMQTKAPHFQEDKSACIFPNHAEYVSSLNFRPTRVLP